MSVGAGYEKVLVSLHSKPALKKDSQFVLCNAIVLHMAKDTGNPAIHVRLTPEMIEALERIVEVGDYKDKSEVIREWSLVLIEAVLVANSTKKAWKGAWEILKGLNRVNERFAKIAKNARENAQQDLLEEQDPNFLEPLERALERQAMREELATG